MISSFGHENSEERRSESSFAVLLLPTTVQSDTQREQCLVAVIPRFVVGQVSDAQVVSPLFSGNPLHASAVTMPVYEITGKWAVFYGFSSSRTLSLCSRPPACLPASFDSLFPTERKVGGRMCGCPCTWHTENGSRCDVDLRARVHGHRRWSGVGVKRERKFNQFLSIRLVLFVRRWKRRVDTSQDRAATAGCHCITGRGRKRRVVGEDGNCRPEGWRHGWKLRPERQGMDRHEQFPGPS